MSLGEGSSDARSHRSGVYAPADAVGRGVDENGEYIDYLLPIDFPELDNADAAQVFKSVHIEVNSANLSAEPNFMELHGVTATSGRPI